MEHRFRYRQGDFEVEFSGSQAYVEAQLAAWLPRLTAGASEKTVPVSAPAPVSDPIEALPRVSPSFRPKVNTSMEEFLAMKDAIAPLDVLVVAAYYLEKYHQQTAYTQAELQAKLEGLKVWECRVVDDVMPLAVETGYLEPLRDDQYTLTFKGQNYVRDGLSA